METRQKFYEIFYPLIRSAPAESAISVLQNLLERWPDFAVAHNDLGVLYYNRGEKEKALPHYREAARLQPENITFRKNLADFYYIEQGRIEEALELYVSILRSHPKDIETLMATGHICESLNKPDDARVFYNRILEIEPWNTEARQKLEPAMHEI